MKIKLKVLNKNKEVEREIIIDELEKTTWIDSDDEDLEAAVDNGLDVLSENNPALFASDEDGKLHGYDFEILDPTLDPKYQ